MYSVEKYYDEVVELVISENIDLLSKAKPGHCLKLVGLPFQPLEKLCKALLERIPSLGTFIISDKNSGIEITATKLIELRNLNLKPIFALIPNSTQTAAEDSYGDATFKNISIEEVDKRLIQKLMHEIPGDKKSFVNTLFELLPQDVEVHQKISYLLFCKGKKFLDDAFQEGIYLLGLIPDLDLFKDSKVLRSRLLLNLECVNTLCDFSQMVISRVEELPVNGDFFKGQLTLFLKNNIKLRNKSDILRSIYEDHRELDFSKWTIPDISFDSLKVRVERISSKNLREADGVSCLDVKSGSSVKVKVRIETNPKPAEVDDLKFYKLILMSVDGGRGEVVTLLRRVKNSSSSRHYRDVNIEIDSNVVDEGAYFIKVLAEDEYGNVLNSDDEFKDYEIQKHWEKVSKKNGDVCKSSLNFKLKCDSDDFDVVLDEQREDIPELRKEKVTSLMQAFIKNKINKLVNKEEFVDPVVDMENSNWVISSKKLHSTFLFSLSDNEKFQVNISNKLRELQSLQLSKKELFGYVVSSLSSDPNEINISSRFVESDLNEYIPDDLRRLRQELFGSICTNQGVLETWNIFKHIDLVKNYVSSFELWVSGLLLKLDSLEDSDKDKESLRVLVDNIQLLDTVKVKAGLGDGDSIDFALISPLHPLRLAWFVTLIDKFHMWSTETLSNENLIENWTKQLQGVFLGNLPPQYNPIVISSLSGHSRYKYSGEICFGWGIYTGLQVNVGKDDYSTEQVKYFAKKLLNIDTLGEVSDSISEKMMYRYLKNYLKQHPYVERLVVNLVNGAEAQDFANALIALEKEDEFKHIVYEVRMFKQSGLPIDFGLYLKMLLNPDSNLSEEAENFSLVSNNRLVPKLRYSLNDLSELIENPQSFSAHITFLISPFSLKAGLVHSNKDENSVFLNGLVLDSIRTLVDTEQTTSWNHWLALDNIEELDCEIAKSGLRLLKSFQSVIANTLAGKVTSSTVSTSLVLSEREKVLLSNVHDISDWIVTFDRFLGPQIYDMPASQGTIPFLLDYIPGEEISGISSFLTTRPSSEIESFVKPYLELFNLRSSKINKSDLIDNFLEDLRSMSSSLILQLNNSRNQAFEVVGMALTKRVLDKKGYLENSFLIPIDLHKGLFDNLPWESHSRADILLVSIDVKKKRINCNVIEVKCRSSLDLEGQSELFVKMQEQMNNTIESLRYHYDKDYNISNDRIDREIKNKELVSFLEFYVDRATRYNTLDQDVSCSYKQFLRNPDLDFEFSFKQVGIIFDFSSKVKHVKKIVDSDVTFFTFGKTLIDEILDIDSDLNTSRLQGSELDESLSSSIIMSDSLLNLLQSHQSANNKLTAKEDKVLASKDRASSELIVEQGEQSELREESERHIEEQADVKSNIVPSEVYENIPEEKTYEKPKFDILIGKSSSSEQYGLLGLTKSNKKIAIDLSETNTISLFGVQGGGKSYTIGTVTEMVVSSIDKINSIMAPLAAVIFHYSESMDYEPEFTSMNSENDQKSEIEKLYDQFGARPQSLKDIVLLTPQDKLDERKEEFPSIDVHPISFNSNEINVQDWMFLLGAIGNDSVYIRQLKNVMKALRNNLNIESIMDGIDNSEMLSNSQKNLARQRLQFAAEYINDGAKLKELIRPGRLVIVDLRDEFIGKDEALGIFVIMLNIFSSVKSYNGSPFNKFIVFDEAHKYMDNKDLTASIVTTIREMRHKGVSIMIASQDPPSLPNEIIELSSIVLLHKFNSPQWLKHIQKSITQLAGLKPFDMSSLQPGEGFLWATKATEKQVTKQPVKITTRARVTKHGGATKKAF